MNKISVVMPVHNTGVLLKKSIGTLETQSMRNFELICVDDGSEDAVTLEILHQYEDICPFFKAIYLEGCVGAAEARNVGLDLATGEYVLFLDSDDEFDEALLETMYNSARQNDADICCCGHEEFYEDGQERHSLRVFLPKEYGSVTQGCFSLKDLDETALNMWAPAPWKLFRRTFLKEYGLRFQTLPSCNDVYFACMSAVLARRICYAQCSKPLIFYRQNVKNQISANRDPENLLKAVRWTLENLKKRRLYFENINKIAAFLYGHAVDELRAGKDKGQCRAFYYDLRRFVVEHEGEIRLSNPVFLYFQDNLLKQEYDSGWFLLIGDFRMQLEMHADGWIETLKGYRRIVLWGMGRRGEAFQHICRENGVELAGVADRSNKNVGGITEYGFIILDKTDVYAIADVVVASNREIYDFLQAEHSGIPCMDLSHYCPY